jgi:hypothetical protein
VVGGALASTEIEETFVALQKEENNFKFIASTSNRTRVMHTFEPQGDAIKVLYFYTVFSASNMC